jgi:hypothetical protein
LAKQKLRKELKKVVPIFNTAKKSVFCFAQILFFYKKCFINGENYGFDEKKCRK